MRNSYSFGGADGGSEHLQQLVDFFVLVDNLIVILGFFSDIVSISFTLAPSSHITPGKLGGCITRYTTSPLCTNCK